MSDDTEMSGITPVSNDPGPARPGFLATTTGKAVVIGGALLALLVILGVVIYIVLGQALVGQLGGPTGSTPTTQTAQTPSTTPSPTVATQVITPVADVDNRDIFTPRDPFKPIAAPRIPGTGTSADGDGSTSGETTSSGTTGDNALVLDDIVTDNGVRKAVLTLNGTQYTVAAGQRVGSSSWKVISISTTSVVLLFGDSRVTLSLGQGISK